LCFFKGNRLHNAKTLTRRPPDARPVVHQRAV
jgi:hypothetical protein